MEGKRTVGREIKCISNMVKRKIDVFKIPEMKELTRAQSMIIGYISDVNTKHDVFQKDIEKEFNIRRSTATQALKVLEMKGYIQRIPVENDMRLKKIVLSRKAIEANCAIRQFLDDFDNSLEEGITSEELEIFFRVTEQIKKNLK